MEEIRIQIGTKLHDLRTDEEFRVIYVGDNFFALIKINSSKIEIEYPSISEVSLKIRNNLFKIIQEESIVFEKESLPDKCKIRYDQRKKLTDMLVNEYGPTYKGLLGKRKKHAIFEYISESKLSKAQVWNIIREYLQSGFNDYSLVDKRFFKKKQESYNYCRKPGRKPKTTKINKGRLLGEKDLKNFNKYMKQYMNSEVKSIQNAYDDMCEECYLYCGNDGNAYVEKLIEDRPTYEQFYHYLRKNTTEQERSVAKNTYAFVRNNEKIHISTGMDGVRGPGHKVEIDAQEMDMSMVSSEYPDICVGRPILYLMIDVFSQIILGYSIALDNNSVVGCTNCFFSLIEDKKELLNEFCDKDKLKEFDLNNINAIWPTDIRPAVLRFDRGSDFISDDVTRIARELDIDIELVTPSGGSFKPFVENFFKNIKKHADDILERQGLIRSVYGSDHHKKACLDINDVRSIILYHILRHNTHALKKYVKSADMLKQKIIATPANLWKYGCENLYNPKKLPSRDLFIYKVLTPHKATISSLGIKFLNMRYFNPTDTTLQELMYHQQVKEMEFNIRMDPRDIGHIYYINEEKLQIASLPENDIRYEGFFGMSLKHFLCLKKENEEIDALADEQNRLSRVLLRRKIKGVIYKKKVKKVSKIITKNMRENRAAEKEKVSRNHSVAVRFKLNVTSKDREGYESIEEHFENNAETNMKDFLNNPKEKKEHVFERMAYDEEYIKRKMRENSKEMFDDDEL